ncbi:MAG: glycosyltransferase family 2 protein [Chitinophagaceae bacterium]
MKVSVITVCYNSSATIETTIKSVLVQTYSNREYIIVDGGSTDGTLDIIKKYPLLKVVSESDRGVYDAMNKGIRLATGDVIGILNSDDIYQDNEVLSDVVTRFNSNSALDILYGDLVYVKKNDTNKVVRKWESKSYFKNFFEYGNVPPHPTLFVKKHVYKEVGFFNIRYKLAADYEFMLRVFKKHRFESKYINRVMVKMRLGGATNKSLKNILNGNKEILCAWRNNGLKIPLILVPMRIIKRLVQFI